MTVVTHTSGCPGGPWTVAIDLLVWNYRRKDKGKSTYLEPVPWPSLMEVFVGHQHWKQKPPLWPLQSFPRSFNTDCWPSESDYESLNLPGSSSSSVSALASGTSGSERVAWKLHLDMLAGSGCSVKAKHKASKLYAIQSLRAGELLLCRAVWRICPDNCNGLHCPPPYL